MYSLLICTYQTARIIANKIGKSEVITNKIFIERDFGALTGKPIKDIPLYSTDSLETDKVTCSLYQSRLRSSLILFRGLMP